MGFDGVMVRIRRADRSQDRRVTGRAIVWSMLKQGNVKRLHTRRSFGPKCHPVKSCHFANRIDARLLIFGLSIAF